MSYHQWWRRRSMRLRHRCCPRRHFPRWGFPSSWRCLWASIHASKVGEECWNFGMYDRLNAMAISIHLEEVAASIQLQAAVVATSKYTRLWETLPTTSRVLDPYKNTVTWKFDSCISKNLNSELKKEENYICDPSKYVIVGCIGTWTVWGEACGLHKLH
jgi:hypothetical protein